MFAYLIYRQYLIYYYYSTYILEIILIDKEIAMKMKNRSFEIICSLNFCFLEPPIISVYSEVQLSRETIFSDNNPQLIQFYS